MEQKPLDQVEEKVDKVMKSEAMKTKIGKLSIGQYLTYNKKALIVTLSIVIVLGILSLIPVIGWFFWWIYSIAFWICALYMTFMIGYKLCKDGRGEIKEALIGGAVVGILYGIIHAIVTVLATIMTVFVFTSALGVTFAFGGLILTIVWILIGNGIGGLVVSLIGFAVAGGFNKEASK